MKKNDSIRIRHFCKEILFLLVVVVFLFTVHVVECLAISNPAAIYCEEMGYQFVVTSDANGDTNGTCIFPDKSSADAWNFYRGKEGKTFSYCVKNGFRMETDRIIQGSYEEVVPVCVSKEKWGSPERIPMIELMEQRGEMTLLHERFMRKRSISGIEETNFVSQVTDKSYPTFLDWRNYNGHTYVGPVRTQGACGSCYAFGAAAAAEGAYNVMNKRYDSRRVDFSEAFIAWCLGKYGPYSNHFSGCDGADYDYAELTALTKEGITYESNFPYTGNDPGGCTHMNDPVVTFQKWGRLGVNNNNHIQWAISNYGTIDVAVYASWAFLHYSSGIFTDSLTTCPDGAYTTTNHAVSLVGWGNDPTHGLYWILRNSHGGSWGENGYMRIKAHAARVACAATYLEAKSAQTIPIITPIIDLLLSEGNAKADDNYEENDTRYTAYDISTNEQKWLRDINGLGIQKDDDWYKIYVTPGYQRVQVNLQFTHDAGDIDIALYNLFGNLLTNSISTSDNENIDFTVSSGGYYYLLVYYGNAGNSYNLWWDDISP